MLDIAPFVISGKLFTLLKNQVDSEKAIKTSVASCAAINSAIDSVCAQIKKSIYGLNFPDL